MNRRDDPMEGIPSSTESAGSTGARDKGQPPDTEYVSEEDKRPGSATGTAGAAPTRSAPTGASTGPSDESADTGDVAPPSPS